MTKDGVRLYHSSNDSKVTATESPKDNIAESTQGKSENTSQVINNPQATDKHLKRPSQGANNTIGNLLLFLLLIGNLALIGMQVRLNQAMQKQEEHNSESMNSFKEFLQLQFGEMNTSLQGLKSETQKILTEQQNLLDKLKISLKKEGVNIILPKTKPIKSNITIKNTKPTPFKLTHAASTNHPLEASKEVFAASNTNPIIESDLLIYGKNTNKNSNKSNRTFSNERNLII